jgi:O-antigen ligase
MILVFLLSTSTTGYLGIAIIVFVILLNMRRFIDAIIITILVYFLGTLLFDRVDEFKSRLNSYSNILSKNELTLDDINSSSFVQYNNFIVAINNFKENPISGTGLGSFPIAYEKYSLTKADDFLIKKGFDFNSQDGNSLLIRALAETGLIGIIFLILIVFKCFVLKQKKHPSITNSISSLISGAFLTLILLTYFRQGNYFLNGFPFFMWMYYYNSKLNF